MAGDRAATRVILRRGAILPSGMVLAGSLFRALVNITPLPPGNLAHDPPCRSPPLARRSHRHRFSAERNDSRPLS